MSIKEPMNFVNNILTKLIQLRPLIRIVRTASSAMPNCLHVMRADDVIRNAYDACDSYDAYLYKINV
uniref:SFRICE_010087 n=1 Tax=Spodoptera frugiperda TaxID=7108 RepID=A0A2H1VH96_SPOFR